MKKMKTDYKKKRLDAKNLLLIEVGITKWIRIIGIARHRMCLQFFRDFHSLSKSNHDIWLIKKPNNHKTNRLGLGLERCTNYLPLSFLRQIVSNFFFSDLPRRALLLPPAIAIAPIAIIRLVITPAPATTDASVSASATATPFSTLARAPPRG